MATVLAEQGSYSVAQSRDSVEFPLCESLSIKLVRVKQKHSYIYPSSGKKVKYETIKYKFDDIPRPNHGFTIKQLKEMIRNMQAIAKKEAILMKHSGIKA